VSLLFLLCAVGGLGDLNYPLVADLKKEICEKYGVLTGMAGTFPFFCPTNPFIHTSLLPSLACCILGPQVLQQSCHSCIPVTDKCCNRAWIVSGRQYSIMPSPL